MKTFVIAEVGINHIGDINIAKQLMALAKETGCDAVKFQKRDIDIVYTQDFLNSPRESPWGATQRAQKAALEFGKAEFDEIDKYARELGIEWFASAWDLNSLSFLDQYKCRYAKVASAMLADIDLLKAIAKRNQYTFISTGLSDMSMVERAVAIFREENCPFELLHCVGTYPMKDEDANLRCINTLQKKFGCKVGYSGHESGVAISIVAVALGATSIERHITLNRAMYGSDQAASLEPAGLRTLVGSIRKVPISLGDGEKVVLADEEKVATKLREHIKNKDIIAV